MTVKEVINQYKDEYDLAIYDSCEEIEYWQDSYSGDWVDFADGWCEEANAFDDYEVEELDFEGYAEEGVLLIIVKEKK